MFWLSVARVKSAQMASSDKRKLRNLMKLAALIALSLMDFGVSSGSLITATADEAEAEAEVKVELKEVLLLKKLLIFTKKIFNIIFFL
jgi:hypothetical protein